MEPSPRAVIPKNKNNQHEGEKDRAIYAVNNRNWVGLTFIISWCQAVTLSWCGHLSELCSKDSPKEPLISKGSTVCNVQQTKVVELEYKWEDE